MPKSSAITLSSIIFGVLPTPGVVGAPAVVVTAQPRVFVATPPPVLITPPPVLLATPLPILIAAPPPLAVAASPLAVQAPLVIQCDDAAEQTRLKKIKKQKEFDEAQNQIQFIPNPVSGFTFEERSTYESSASGYSSGSASSSASSSMNSSGSYY